MTIEQFRENMGLLGMEINSVLSDRIFNVLDKDSDGKI